MPLPVLASAKTAVANRAPDLWDAKVSLRLFVAEHLDLPNSTSGSYSRVAVEVIVADNYDCQLNVIP